MRAFLAKAWRLKSLPPMWMWKPTWFRRVAMIPYVPVSLVWNVLILPLLIFVFAAVIAGLEEMRELNWPMAFRWCRQTWQGVPFRPWDDEQ